MSRVGTVSRNRAIIHAFDCRGYFYCTDVKCKEYRHILCPPEEVDLSAVKKCNVRLRLRMCFAERLSLTPTLSRRAREWAGAR
jgi:hypothetical protein